MQKFIELLYTDNEKLIDLKQVPQVPKSDINDT